MTIARAVRRATVAAVYGAHPLATRPAATEAELKAITPAALDAFRAAHYRPRGAVLVLTGSFSWSLMEQHVRAAFADWQGDADPPIAAATPADRAAWIGIEDDDDDLWIGARVASASGTPADEAAARVAAAVLDERIAQVRARLGAAYSLGAWFVDDPVAPGIALGGAIDAGRAEPACRIVADALAGVRGGTITGDELRRAQIRVVRELSAEIAGDDFARRVGRVVRRGGAVDHDAAVAEAVRGLADPHAVAAVLRPAQVVTLTGRTPAIEAGFRAFGATADPLIRAEE